MNVRATPQAAEPQPFLLRIEDYELLDRAGAFGDARVELIGGRIVAMSPQQRPHSYAKNELTFRLRLALASIGSRFSAQSEPTVAIPPHDAIEPDIVVTDAPRGEGYVPVSSLALVIEVADASLRYDLTRKRDRYAAAGVPEYWVVDVNAGVVHRFCAPLDGRYRDEAPLPLAGALPSLSMPGLVIDGDGII